MSPTLPILAALAAAFAPAPFAKRTSSNTAAEDLRTLQGEWRRLSRTIGGRSLGLGAQTTLTIKGSRMQFAVDGRSTREWTFSLEARTNPRRLDRKEVGAVGTVRLGIYRIEGDTFTLHSSDAARPGDFTGSGNRVIVEVFKRK
jgi:uncharacterized protein (TIGR03067 family)